MVTTRSNGGSGGRPGAGGPSPGKPWTRISVAAAVGVPAGGGEGHLACTPHAPSAASPPRETCRLALSGGVLLDRFGEGSLLGHLDGLLGGLLDGPVLRAPAWAWLLVPLAGLLVLGGLVVWAGRHAARRDAPLRLQSFLTAALLVGALAALGFAAVHVGAPLEPAVKLRNVAWWFLGTALGCAAVLLLARKAAPAPRFSHPDPPAASGRTDEDPELETPHA